MRFVACACVCLSAVVVHLLYVTVVLLWVHLSALHVFNVFGFNPACVYLHVCAAEIEIH